MPSLFPICCSLPKSRYDLPFKKIDVEQGHLPRPEVIQDTANTSLQVYIWVACINSITQAQLDDLSDVARIPELHQVMLMLEAQDRQH